MTVSTKEPLEEAERATLLRSFDQFPDDLDKFTTRIFYSTGCHPWSLAHPDRANWKIVSGADGTYLTYLRAKTYEQTRLVMDPGVEPWIEAFLEEELGHSEHEYARRVRRWAEKAGLSGMTPRTLRHDCIYRFLREFDWNLVYAVATFGTDARTLVGYASRHGIALQYGRLRMGAFK